MEFRAVIFDLDGTLLNSLFDIADAANTILRKHGFPTHATDAYRYFVGDGIRRLVERIVPAPCRDDTRQVEAFADEFIDLYRQTWNVRSRLYDGVAEMLCGIVDRKIAMAVLSNKPHESTCRCVEHYLSQFSFAVVMGQGPTRPPKPDLTGVSEIVDRLEVSPRSCLFLGDTAVDMQTALGAEMFPVGAAWGFRGSEELQEAGARLVIREPLELLDILDGTGGSS